MPEGMGEEHISEVNMIEICEIKGTERLRNKSGDSV